MISSEVASSKKSLSLSSEAVLSLRSETEESAISRAGRSVPHSPTVAFMPGAEFYQLDSKFALVTYMILGNSVYCYEQFTFSWVPMRNARPGDIRMANKLIKRLA